MGYKCNLIWLWYESQPLTSWVQLLIRTRPDRQLCGSYSLSLTQTHSLSAPWIQLRVADSIDPLLVRTSIGRCLCGSYSRLFTDSVEELQVYTIPGRF
jgi:hypothetical protein